MSGDKPSYVESLAVAKGRILHAGPLAQSLKFNGTKTRLENLRGKTLLPGFFDTHSQKGTVGFAVTLGNLFSGA
jgi:predicted amidohydrolase YtcJ